MEVPIKKFACIFVCVLAASAAAFRPAKASLSTCHPREFKTFLHDLNSQCPFSTPLYLSAIQAAEPLHSSYLVLQTSIPRVTAILERAYLYIAVNSLSILRVSSDNSLQFYLKCGVLLDVERNGTALVDEELLESVMSSTQKNVYTAVLYYASWCPFSRIFQSKFSTLSSMYPQIKHLMVEQSSAVPSVFSRYGVHSVPSLLIVNQNMRWKHHGRRDLTALVNFYKRATGLDPVVDMIEDNLCSPVSNQKILKPWNGGSFTEIIWRELYLVLSVLFVLSRAILHFFPEIVSRITELWVACIPHLNLGIFGESRQLLGRVFHLIDVKRIWSKLKVCKTRNFHEGARNARVWASSLASVSLGETSSTRIFPSRDL